MRSVDLVINLYEQLIEKTQQEYQQELATLPPNSDVIKYLQMLPKEGQEEVLQFMTNTISWNAVSHILAWLQGMNFIDNQTSAPVLYEESNPDNRLNEDLFDYWVMLTDDEMSKQEIIEHYQETH